MTRDLRDQSPPLPDTLPIFPLPGAILLPHGHLPLNIFEPRYLNMIDWALGHGRMIGMVQPREPQSGLVADDAPVFGVGGAGRIVSFSETEDSRYLITLAGVSRFRIASELPTTDGFRNVATDFGPFAADLIETSATQADRPRLLKAMRQYLKARDLGADWSAIEQASDDALVTSLAMTCPFEPGEKQALLECDSPAARAEMLISLLEIEARAADSAAGSVVRH